MSLGATRVAGRQKIGDYPLSTDRRWSIVLNLIDMRAFCSRRAAALALLVLGACASQDAPAGQGLPDLSALAGETVADGRCFIVRDGNGAGGEPEGGQVICPIASPPSPEDPSQ